MAFVPTTSFIPRCIPSQNVSTRRNRAPVMLESKEVRRSAEIERLTKQLEQLRAKRQNISNEAPPASSAPPSALSNNAPVQETAIDNSATSADSNQSVKFGKHSSGNRFMSISNLTSNDYFPRILTVAGSLPDLTVDHFFQTPSVLQSKSPEAGNMFITMLPPDYKGQIVALPGWEILANCNDPVAILAKPSDISAETLPAAEDDYVVIVVDRDITGTEFDKRKFYAWAVGDNVHIGWLDSEPLPEQAKRIGNVVIGMVDMRPELRKSKSCWEEENETYAD